MASSLDVLAKNLSSMISENWFSIQGIFVILIDGNPNNAQFHKEKKTKCSSLGEKV